jgi:hypothetical protein
MCASDIQRGQVRGFANRRSTRRRRLSLRLSCHRSLAFFGNQLTLMRAQMGSRKTVTNGPVRSWKAGWVQALAGSNPASSAALTRGNNPPGPSDNRTAPCHRLRSVSIARSSTFARVRRRSRSHTASLQSHSPTSDRSDDPALLRWHPCWHQSPGIEAATT